MLVALFHFVLDIIALSPLINILCSCMLTFKTEQASAKTYNHRPHVRAEGIIQDVHFEIVFYNVAHTSLFYSFTFWKQLCSKSIMESNNGTQGLFSEKIKFYYSAIQYLCIAMKNTLCQFRISFNLSLSDPVNHIAKKNHCLANCILSHRKLELVHYENLQYRDIK